MATVVIEGNDLVISMNGLDRLWAFKSQLTIPLDHVRGITVDPSVVRESKGRRGPGAHTSRASSSPAYLCRTANASSATFAT